MVRETEIAPPDGQSPAGYTEKLAPAQGSVMLSIYARVVKWQTRTFEGRMPQGMGVQVPPRAPLSFLNP